jgi:Zn finger protein HypA/HybF involved in hydrogenase expression
MEFQYKCPVCRANNILTTNNIYCRRCKSNLASIYNIKKKRIFEVIKMIINSNYKI